jgi:hypothetical protein
MKNRDKKGKYSYSDFELVCICGHKLGRHTAEYPHDCCYGEGDGYVQQDCVCQKAGFKPQHKLKK